MTAVTEPARSGTLAMGSIFEQVPALAGLDPADPYAVYDTIFGDPFLVEQGDVAVVTRYSQCFELLRHPKVMSSQRNSTAFRGLNSSLMHSLDPPEHTRIRSVVNKALTRRSVDALAPWLLNEVHSLIDAAAGGPTFDVIGGLAYPLPLNTICQMLGFPLADRELIVEWGRPISYGIDVLAGRRSREEQKANRTAGRDFRRYIEKLIEERRREPGDDLLSRLVFAEQTIGEPLTDREIAHAAMLLLIAGHETTVSTVAHGAMALADHPELAAQVAADPNVAEAFVDEVLRFYSPLQVIWRVAAEDLTVGPLEVPAGAALVLLLGAANRDGDQFEEPNRFDIFRSNNRTHIDFGGGHHFCPGASLGKLEARLALSALAGRLVNPRLDASTVTYRKGVMMRVQERVDLTVDGVLPRPVEADGRN